MALNEEGGAYWGEQSDWLWGFLEPRGWRWLWFIILRPPPKKKKSIKQNLILEIKQKFGFFGITAYIVGIIIGSGIFLTSNQIFKR